MSISGKLLGPILAIMPKATEHMSFAQVPAAVRDEHRGLVECMIDWRASVLFCLMQLMRFGRQAASVTGPFWLALFLGAGSVCVFAQTVDPNFATGTQLFGSYHGGNIDNISLLTGGNNVDVPLISYPQRGDKLKLDFVLHFTSTQWYADQVCPLGPPCVWSGLPSYVHGFTVIPAGAPAIFGWGGTSITGSICASLPGGGNPNYISDCNATFNMSDGGGHAMWAIGPTSFLAVDGSGYRMDMPAGISSGMWVVSDPEGTKYSLASNGVQIVAEDTNGNQIINSGTGTWTDTFGRTISSQAFVDAASAYINGSTGDTTHCTGPLPIAYAVTWDLPGINRGSYPLKFCYVLVSETIPIQVVGASQTYNALQLQSVVRPDNSAWTF